MDSDTETLTLDSEHRATGLTVVYHPRLDRIGERTLLTGLGTSFGQTLARQEPLFAQPGSALGRPLGTKRLSRRPILLSTSPQGGARLDPAGSRTAVEIDGIPLLGPMDITPDRLEQGVVLLLGQMIVLLLHRMEPMANDQLPHFDLLGESPGMLKLRQDIDRLADLNLPALIQGEPGTDKPLIAAALHGAGPRADGPFVTVEIAADKPSLHPELEQALQQAEGGSLFLQNLDEADAATQIRLLELLSPRSDTEPAPRIRLISSSDSNLELASSLDQFNPGLFQAAGELIIRTVPLRERREDFGRLFSRSLADELESHGEPDRLSHWDPPWIPASVWSQLAAAPWPGNLHQLREFSRRLVEDNLGRDQVTELDALEGVTG